MAKRKATVQENGPRKSAMMSLNDLSEGDLSDSDSAPVSDDAPATSGAGDDSFAGFSEEEEESENSQDENEDETPSSKATRKLKGEDVRIARETSELYKSNVFKLQIDELINQITLDEKYITSANKILFKLKDTLLAAKEILEHSVESVQSALPNQIPFPDPKPEHDSRLKFQFLPPTNVNIIGSYSLQTIVRQPEGSAIDLLVEMPEELFEKKDYLNHRYFHKRAFYVACIANAIAQNSTLKLKVRYQYISDDVLRPILRVEFTDSKLAKQLHILIHFGINSEVFPARKLANDRNAVRSVEEPTPRYNNSVLSDMAHEFFLKYLHAASAQSAAFNQAVKLGRLWLRKRGFGSSPQKGGFGSFEFAVLMAALLNGGLPNGKRVLLHDYSSYQLFRATLLYIAKNDIDLALSASSHTVPAMSGEVCLEVDELNLNVLEKMPQWAKGLLKHEAAVASDLLSDVTRDRFADIFLKDITNVSRRFDQTFTVELPPLNGYEPEIWPSYQDFKVHVLESILSRAWDQRVKNFAVLNIDKDAEEVTTWALSSTPPVPNEDNTVNLTVGTIVDPESAEKRVTFGPGPEDKDALKLFREFWGSKSNLRRFQDGNIKEAVVWKQGIESVVLEVAKYALQKHLHGSVTVPRLVESLLPVGPVHGERSPSSVAPFQQKYTDFQECARMLQELKDLPLRISAVYGTSSSLRYTSLRAPGPFQLSDDDSLSRGLILLESSGKWPDDTEAIEKTKIALLIKIAETVRKTAPTYAATIGVEPSQVAGDIETGFLVLQSAAGYNYRFSIATHKDERVFEKKLGSKNTEDSLLSLRRGGVSGSNHNRLIATVAQRHPFYSATARLLKLWFQKHLLGTLISEQAIELLALKPFIDSAPYVPPQSVTTAFYRVVDFLSTWNWKDDPLVYDISNTDKDVTNVLTSIQGTQMEASAFQTLATAFNKHRQTDPALTLSPYFIGTRVDPTGILWTQTLPRSRVGVLVAARVTALSRGVVQLIGSDDLESMFTPALGDYDLEIRLSNPSASKGSYKNLAGLDPSKVTTSFQNVGLEFFSDIAAAYRECLTLFYSGSMNDNVREEQVITGIWNKEALAPQKFRVNIPYSTKPTGSGDEVVVNKEAVIQEILRLGGEMVTLNRM